MLIKNIILELIKKMNTLANKNIATNKKQKIL